MPKSHRTQKTRSNTLGNGDCAFNAFGSRLSCADLLDAIERNIIESDGDPNAAFRDFIDLVAVATPEKINATWNAVRDYLTHLQATNPFALQRFLTPILRNLFHSLALDDKAEYESTEDVKTHYGRTIENLLASYQNFVDTKLGIAPRNHVEDDILSDHPFIREYFETIFKDNGQYKRYKELKKKVCSEAENAELLELEIALFTEQQDTVLTWWNDIGYRTFVEGMANPRFHKWAGDLELYLLAKYFRINLNVETCGVPYDVYVNYGSVPKENTTSFASTIPQLVTRGIINNPGPDDTDYSLLQINNTKLSQRLSNIPNYDVVLGFINGVQGRLKGRAVPQRWPVECIEELLARDIITSRNNGKTYVFYVSADDAKQRMKEVSAKDTIVEALQDQIVENPTMHLTHDGGHYEYVPPPKIRPTLAFEHEVAETLPELDKKDEEQATIIPKEVIQKLSNPNHNVKDVTEDLLNFNQMEPDQQTWEESIAKVIDKLSIEQESSGEWIKYSFLYPRETGFNTPGVDDGYVTRAEQIAMDEALARALQKKGR